jgi:NCAIR mutase (PurE)-related protein
MRDLLEAVAAGETSVDRAEAALRGYATGEAGRFDAARESRTGVPEAVLAEGKTPGEAAELAALAVRTAGRAIVTRTDEATRTAVTDRVADDHPDAEVTVEERARTVVVHGGDYEPPALDADVGVVTGGTADAAAAGEAAVVLREMGARVSRVSDVGVAGIGRLFDRLEELRAQDALVVAAGREGALPTVVGGLVDCPVVGLPVSAGYGYGGDGEAALVGMLQSCTPIAVVNVDNGFAAAAQAGQVARALDAERD